VKTNACSNCGALATVVRGDYEFGESGLDYVVLNNIELFRCGNCGNVDPIIRNSKRLMERLLVGVASKSGRLEGQDVRFIRKQLKMTQESLGRLIHTDKTTISKWENNADPIGEQSDLLIRSLAITLSDLSKELGRKIVEGFGEIASQHATSTSAMSLDAANDYALKAT
jgi:putative zinc finger/helix-turn-helix YgiT family protein